MTTAGLISHGREAQRRPRRLEARPLAESNGWLETYRRFWEGNFQRLDALLDEMKNARKRQKRATHMTEGMESGHGNLDALLASILAPGRK